MTAHDLVRRNAELIDVAGKLVAQGFIDVHARDMQSCLGGRGKR